MIEKVGFLAVWVIVFAAKAMNIPAAVQHLISFKTDDSSINYRPIIGILSQDIGTSTREAFSSNYSSYIASSYVKFVESAGARVVPVMINQPDAYYEKLANSLNGFLFPGGRAEIDNRSGYGRAGRMIYSLVLKHGRIGKPIPLWGTCLGFEMIAYLVANGTNPLTKCHALNIANTLQLQPDFRYSKLFNTIPDSLQTDMQIKKITTNFHINCVTPKTFLLSSLDSSLLLLTTSGDSEGIEFVSTIEHRTLPIYGTQWHPEKPPFEWNYHPKHNNIPHTKEAVQLSQYLADSFIQEARKNLNHFTSESEAEKYLIYNYSPVYIQKIRKSPFQQIYLF